MKYVFYIMFLALCVELKAQVLHYVAPLNKSNIWVYEDEPAYSPITSRFIRKIIDSNIIINGKGYYLLQTKDTRIGSAAHNQYVRYDSTDGYYKAIDSAIIGDKESPYYKKNAKKGDRWNQPSFAYQENLVYYSVLDTVTGSVFGKLVNVKFIIITDSLLIIESEVWCEEFGSLKVGYEGGSSRLVGCVIDGKAYGDTVSIPTDVIKETTAQPKNYFLYQNYPNPFNPSTKIRYYLPQYSHVNLRVFDMLGNEISILIDEYKDAGMHEAIFDSGRLSSGCYLCRFEADNHIETKKLILLK